MHNPAFLERVLAAVRQRGVDLPADVDKGAAFRALRSRHGASALVEVGRQIWLSKEHPIVQALIRPSSVRGVLAQWMRLEHFSHTHNRTRILAEVPSEKSLVLRLEHYALDDGSIEEESHLFVWGVLVGLFDRANRTVDSVSLNEGRTTLIDRGSVVPSRDLPRAARVAEFTWNPIPTATSPPIAKSPDKAELADAIRQIVASNVSRPWKVAEVARLIGVAPRSLQRALTNANTTFRDVVIWARLGHAGALMSERQLSLADIAFCAGFADQAHMTRVARAHWMLAPAQFRSLVG